MYLALLLPLVTLPLSLAKNISISVGQAGLAFDPEVVTANTGDLLQFHFYPKNHSVAQSSFSSPCHPLTGGVYSGFMPETAEGESVFQVTVNNTDPIYLYCAQIEHCQKGMAMAVNPPLTGNNTLAAYKQAATNASTVAPPAIAGGVFVAANDNSTSSSSTASFNTSSTATATATATSTSSTTTSTSTTVASKGGAVGKSILQHGLLGWVALSGVVLASI